MGDEETAGKGPAATDAEKAAAAKAAADKVIADAAAAAATAEPTGSTETTPKGEKEWEARFKGLQPKYQTLVEARKVETKAWDDERLKLMGTVAELETAQQARQTSLDDITKKLESAATATTEQTTIVDDLNKKLERNALIMSKYPDLALMEAKGLLPPDKEGEDLIKALDDMRSILSSTGQKVIQDLAAGATLDGVTVTGSRTQGDDVTSISEKLMEANIKGDAVEIARLTKLLIAEQDKVYAANPASQASSEI